jgi:hypothetical protein
VAGVGWGRCPCGASRDIRVASLTILLTAFLVLMCSEAQAGCRTSTDCGAGQTCTKGECTTERGASAPLDTVFLKNGGRVRGTVIEEEPERGVRLKLADGTLRSIKPSEVDHVTYADAAAPSPPPAAPVTTAPLPVASAPVAPTPLPGRCQVAGDCPAGAQCHEGQCVERNSTEMMIAGIVLLPVGTVAGIVGAVYAGVDGFHHGGVNALLWISGGSALVAGIVLLSVGAPKVPVGESLSATTDVTVEPLVGPTAAGVRVRF